MPAHGPPGLLIAIADDHPLMRAALAEALRPVDRGVRFAEAADYAGALALLRADPPVDLMLMDLHMPGADGMEGVRGARAAAPHVPLAVVSADDDPAIVRALLRLGVSGFIPKTESPAVIGSAVRLILAGGVYVPPRLLADSGAAAPAGEHDARPPPLTDRQMEVVRLLARGLSNKAIARELGVTEGTVKVHLLAVFRVLDVRNRTAAVLEAQRFLH
jgi:DNA-binding NarL/FixJ family response regulator